MDEIREKEEESKIIVFCNSIARMNELHKKYGDVACYLASKNAEKVKELPDFSAHTFRHTFCTRMAENGIDVKVLQEIMGHKTIAITMQVYNHVLEGRAEAEMQRVSSALVV